MHHADKKANNRSLSTAQGQHHKSHALFVPIVMSSLRAHMLSRLYVKKAAYPF